MFSALMRRPYGLYVLAAVLAALLCPIGLWGTYLFFGPCTLPRYILPLFCLAPVLLSVAYLPAPGEAG